MKEFDLIAVLTFIVLCVQTFVFGLQAKRLRETVTKMDETARIQLRAYVNLEEGFAIVPVVGQHAAATVTLKNCGATPALKCRHLMAVKVLTNPYPDSLPALNVAHYDPALVSTFSMSGGGILVRSAAEDRAWSQQDIDAVIRGRLQIVVYGHIEYEDVFGHAHKTSYHLFHRAGTMRHDNAWQLTLSSRGNDAT